jgi:hypothetical protein
MPALAEAGYMPIAPDLCGFGASDRPAPADAQALSGEQPGCQPQRFIQPAVPKAQLPITIELSNPGLKVRSEYFERSFPVTSLIAALILAA